MPRKKKENVGEDFKICVSLVIKNFRLNAQQKEYEFPSSLSSADRAYVHRYCQKLGLKSKSRGEGANRFLTVYKKEGSTIVQADAIFQLGHVSRHHALNLLQKYPLTARERQELIPPTERDRILGQENTREVNRATFRLTTGIPQVPPRMRENEYTLFRQSLPIWHSRDEIIQMISCHQVVLISGETGSGKTTQIPQYILEHCHLIGQTCRIICTQPRRIAAINVAERVALERDDKVGQTVGYQIRLESRVSPKTILTFCTNGVLLRTLMNGDASLATVSHIIVDELHERDRFSDFLLIVLRDLLLKFKGLRLVLMSASLDTQLFSKYFSNCPVIEVPGRTYEVKTFFLEDILKGTGYTNRMMLKYKSNLENQKCQKKKLDSWCSSQMQACSSASSDEVSEEDKLLQSLNELTFTPPEIIQERTEVNPQLAEAMDKAIENAWIHAGEKDFTKLLHLIISAHISVDYRHQETSATPLMVASGRGNVDVIEQLLSLGASVQLRSSNEWTAIDWANQFGQTEAAELLASHWNCANIIDKNNTTDAKLDIQMTEEDKLLLEAYNHSVDEDKIDHDLMLCLLQRICASHEEGAVLIFLPGYDDIISLREKIINCPSILDNRTTLFTLHSQMQSIDQKRVFKPVPSGCRKIILSTNIAETSITINDVVFVIDSGKVKEKSYDALSGVTQLKVGWVPKASAIQRRGRAGRCRTGLCYHLYSRVRFNSFQKFQIPEILRVPIHELCLQAKLLAPPNAPIADFLAKAPDPPPFMVTRNAVILLKTIDALDPWEELTELGLHLLDLPIEPRLGKMVLYSVILKCIDPVLTIVCCLAYRDPFLIPSQPVQKRAATVSKKRFAQETFSDHMALLRAFQAWQKAKAENHEHVFCSRNFLSPATMEIIVGMRTQLLGQLRASGFVKTRGAGDIRDLNANSESWPTVKAALCAGTYPNLIRIDRDRKQLITQKESKVRFHQSSVLNKIPMSSKQTVNDMHHKIISELPSDWLIYEEMMRTGLIAHAHCCTLVSPITVAVFAGAARLPLDALHEPDQARMEGGYIEDDDSEDESEYDTQKSMMKIDDWISFRIEPEIARLALQLRQKWHALFLRRMHNPSKPWSQADEAVVRSIVGVLTAEEQALGLHQPTGIGQRPRPMSLDFTPSMNLGRQPSPSHRNVGYYSSGGSNSSGYGSAQPYGMMGACSTSSMSSTDSSGFMNEQQPRMTPSCSASNYGPALDISSMPHSFVSSQPVPSGMENISGMGTPPIRYFIIKANTSRAVEVSMTRNIWAFPPSIERKLLQAVREGSEVILIFSIQGSGHFQGFARFTPCVASDQSFEISADNPGPFYEIEWLKRANVPFQSTRHLQNAWNDNRKVQISRDGQELEPSVGEALCRLLWRGQPVLTSDCNMRNRRPFGYARENIPPDPTLGRMQPQPPQWDAPNIPSPSAWYDTPAAGQRNWSQSST